MSNVISPRIYGCFNCMNHVALHDDILSKDFVAGRRRAFLFSHVMNVVAGRKMDRQLITGLHTIAYVHCSDCKEFLGWRYEKAYVEAQKYKESKTAGRRRAFLFSHVMNVVAGRKMDRQLITGLHTIAYVHCSDCKEFLGWRYEKAYVEAQKYKESKTVLIKCNIVKDNW
ncbi:Yippee-like protein [Artemisia annua]|uniref:Yippee-like protein n=1 Tax=Artemisia annua TaxID=35608 RepID=A0A2U1KX71_ARTAN|nr:Yippee-like protein [Artemisia annua]